MTSIEATEMLFKIRDMLNDKDLNMFMELTSYECGAKMEDVKFCFDMLVKEFTSVNPYENIDVSKLNSVEKEFVVDQEAKIKNSVPKIHDEIE